MNIQDQATIKALFEGLPDDPKTTLLKRLLLDPEQHYLDRIFVNRNLRMEKIHYIGFDLDWTLANYDRLPLEQLTFELVIERLIKKFDYPDIIYSAEFRPDFSHRGLLIDKLNGTIIKMDRHRYVGRAYLGREELNAQQRLDLYRQNRIDLTRERFYHVDTLFELVEVNIYSEITHIQENSPQKLPLSKEQIFKDIRTAIDNIHADGSLKGKILKNLTQFLPKDPSIALTLYHMAQADRKLILITNSEWYYTDAICSYLFNQALPGLETWRTLFNLVIVSAQKPLFFRDPRPFIELDKSGIESEAVLIPKWGKAYRAGSRDGLMSLLGSTGERVLYIGDHIYGDIRWTRMSSTWRTALIIRELEHELFVQQNLSSEIRHLNTLRAELMTLGQQLDLLRNQSTLLNGENIGNPGITKLRKIILENLEKTANQHGILRSRTSDLQEYIWQHFNPTWGSLFKQGASQSLFANQVEDFACLYTAQAKNFLHYGSTHYFRVTTDPMAHEGEC